MRRSFIIAWAFLLAGLCCIQQSSAFWQSRDSNYNNASFQAQYQGPLDVYSTSVFGCYALRACSLSYAGSKSISACNPANTCADLSSNANGNLVESTIGGSACYVTISSGTYVSATGALALTTSAGVTSFASGSNFALSALTGTGSFTSLNAGWTATTGTTGTTVNATVTTGLGTVTITGGIVSVCPIAEAYEQSGGGAPGLTQATVSAQPILTHDCIGTLPCMTFTRTGSAALAGTITGFVLNSGTTFSLVAERTGNTTSYSGGANISGGSVGIYFSDTSNTISVQFGGSGAPTLTAADSSFHAAQGVEVSNTNCWLYVDGSSNNVVANCGNLTTSTSLSLGNLSSNYLNGKIAEGIFWKAAMNSTNAGAVCHNQTVYYGISGATC